MRVNPKDGTCRSCGGPLDIVDASEDTLTVECSGCYESYDVEVDAFHDGGVTYWPEAMAKKFERRDE
jgi:hypothetical protein